jgi:hypothetical protein
MARSHKNGSVKYMFGFDTSVFKFNLILLTLQNFGGAI